MRPKTRSSNAKASSSKDKLPNKAVKQEETSDSDSDDDDLMAISIGNHLEQLSKQFKKMKREVKELRRRNDGLTQDLNDARAEAAENEPSTKKGKKAGPTAASLQKEVVALKSRIEQYEKTERKNKKTIEKLRQKELKKEADDLNDDAAGTLETEDSAYRLRTLLRRFGDIMAANSLEADEECGICVEVLEVNETVSFPCQHIMCEECFKGISPNKDEIKCPYCRRETARDEIETVRYTAASQWDELLKIAKNFAIMDHTYRREQDTSEEEEEEDFLNDAEDSEPAYSSNSLMFDDPIIHDRATGLPMYLPNILSPNQHYAVAPPRRTMPSRHCRLRYLERQTNGDW
ncbi:hypothetical protein BXZ70DRAFT_1009841 [Cristinia sonorae]|uniref:RING-type domain-containing protein n=1 Tax=Cristinia sonorae TaxID=1940300 RepID=A0A8K0UJZ7_9AGAR|nr:hypothetical protein BXZ70DRAFT_1009841 [Cristinia sonorae]